MRKLLFFVVMLSLSVHLAADIFKCKDEQGKTSFQDGPCEENASSEKVDVQVNSFDSEENLSLERPKNPEGDILYSDHSGLVAPYTIKVHEVRVVFEDKSRITLDVIYTYEHDIPADEIKIGAYPNHAYWSVQSARAKPGKNVVRLTTGLSKSNMDKDYKNYSSTSSIRIAFHHYPPDNTYGGTIWDKTVKYRKEWRLN